MRRITLLTSAAFAFFCLILSGVVQAGEVPVDFSGQRMQVYCASDAPGYYEAKGYFSDVFEIQVPPNAGYNYPNEMSKAFADYLKQQYGYVNSSPGNVQCALMEYVQTARGSKDLGVTAARYNRQRAGYADDPVVETEWKLSADQAPAPAPPKAPAPAAAAGF